MGSRTSRRSVQNEIGASRRRKEGSAKEKVKVLSRAAGGWKATAKLRQFYRVNCIGVRRAESRRTGFLGPAEITFSGRTWRRKRNAARLRKRLAKRGTGEGQRGSCISVRARAADGYAPGIKFFETIVPDRRCAATPRQETRSIFRSPVPRWLRRLYRAGRQCFLNDSEIEFEPGSRVDFGQRWISKARKLWIVAADCEVNNAERADLSTTCFTW